MVSKNRLKGRRISLGEATNKRRVFLNEGAPKIFGKCLRKIRCGAMGIMERAHDVK